MPLGSGEAVNVRIGGGLVA